MKQHPDELELASLAELPFFRRFLVERHVRQCDSCERQVAEFAALRAEMLAVPEPQLNWDSLAAEMRANIRLGIEAGECVREAPAPRSMSPGLIVAFASLLLLVGAAVVMRQAPANRVTASRFTAAAPTASDYRVPVLETSMQGIEMRTGPASFAFLNREGGAESQTVSAEGAVRSRDIDGDTGSVTIRDVYLQ